MADRDALGLLHAQLWSLRAEVESQIRNLTQVHREIDNLRAVEDPRRDAEVSRLVSDLEQILDANHTVRALCETALEEARSLPRRTVKSGEE